MASTIFLCSRLIPIPAAMRASLERDLRKFFLSRADCLGKKSRNALCKPRSARTIGLRADKRHWTLYMTNAIMLRLANTSKKMIIREEKREEKLVGKTEKFHRVLVCGVGDIFFINAENFGSSPQNNRNVGGLVYAPAQRNRRKVWTICFEH